MTRCDRRGREVVKLVTSQYGEGSFSFKFLISRCAKKLGQIIGE